MDYGPGTRTLTRSGARLHRSGAAGSNSLSMWASLSSLTGCEGAANTSIFAKTNPTVFWNQPHTKKTKPKRSQKAKMPARRAIGKSFRISARMETSTDWARIEAKTKSKEAKGSQTRILDHESTKSFRISVLFENVQGECINPKSSIPSPCCPLRFFHTF